MEEQVTILKSEHSHDDSYEIIQEEIHIKDEDSQSCNENPYKCGICGHRTTTDTLLKVHMKMHLLKRLHQCGTCDKTFNFVTDLNSHILTHRDEKTGFQCTLCTKYFFTVEDLQRHNKFHTKPLKCQFCSRNFSVDTYLTNHLRVCHGDQLQNVKKQDIDLNVIQDNQNMNEDKPEVSALKEKVCKVNNKRRFKNHRNLPLNNEEKLMLVQFVAKLGINEHYSKLDHIKHKLKNSWSKMIELFAERGYDRSADKLARTYFHLKHVAKTHIERFYKLNKLPEPNEIDYICVKLCPTDFDTLGIDVAQVIEDSKKFGFDEVFKDENVSLENGTDCEIVEFPDTNRVHEPGKRKLSNQDGPPSKTSKIVESDESAEVKQLQMKFLIDEENRREHLFQLELQQKATLFEMDKKHREEIYEKELEIKNLELKLLREKVKHNRLY